MGECFISIDRHYSIIRPIACIDSVITVQCLVRAELDRFNIMSSSEMMVTKDKTKPGVGQVLRKYFWEGQKLDEKQQDDLLSLPGNASLWKRILVKHRLLVGIMIPLSFFQILWWMLE